MCQQRPRVDGRSEASTQPCPGISRARIACGGAAFLLLHILLGGLLHKKHERLRSSRISCAIIHKVVCTSTLIFIFFGSTTSGLRSELGCLGWYFSDLVQGTEYTEYNFVIVAYSIPMVRGSSCPDGAASFRQSSSTSTLAQFFLGWQRGSFGNDL